MNQTVVRWCSEYVFVFTALILLKSVLFPFVLWWWFPASDLASTLLEATSLVFSVITTIILLGLGSISRYRYQLSFMQAVGAYLVINLPFVILWYIPLTRQWASWWWSLAGDGIQLWFPSIVGAKGLMLWLIGFLLVIVGRLIYVRDEESKQVQVGAKN